MLKLAVRKASLVTLLLIGQQSLSYAQINYQQQENSKLDDIKKAALVANAAYKIDVIKYLDSSYQGYNVTSSEEEWYQVESIHHCLQENDTKQCFEREYANGKKLDGEDVYNMLTRAYGYQIKYFESNQLIRGCLSGF